MTEIDERTEFDRVCDALDDDEQAEREKALAWMQGYAAGAEAVRAALRLDELSAKAWEVRMAASGWVKP